MMSDSAAQTARKTAIRTRLERRDLEGAFVVMEQYARARNVSAPEFAELHDMVLGAVDANGNFVERKNQ